MRLHGAFSFGRGWNPFLAALAGGPEALREFYARFQPKSIAAFYFLEGEGNDCGVPVWGLPWLDWRKHRPPTAEGGLDREHGVSYYGPCTAEKVAVEYSRLSDLLESIRRIGYVPASPIRGFVMRRGNEERFFVRGGKHRAVFHGGVPVRFFVGAAVRFFDARTRAECATARIDSVAALQHEGRDNPRATLCEFRGSARKYDRDR